VLARGLATIASFELLGFQESASSVREQAPPISASGAKRRSTRIVQTVPILVTWLDGEARTIAEETATLSINCHGFQYFSRQGPQRNAAITIQLIARQEHKLAALPAYQGRVAWLRKSRRLDGLYLVGIEFAIPLNIWSVDEVPDDWVAFSRESKEDAAFFLAEVDRFLHSARTATYYQLLGVNSQTSRSEVKRHFYQLASRFHPDHHMDHPEWTPRLLALMDKLTTAYKTLSDGESKKEYDSLLARGNEKKLSDSRKMTQDFLDKARECMAEKNFVGGILWLRRAIEMEPDSSSHRAMLGRCLSAIPEYWREAVDQFEMAIELDPRNFTAHIQYGELLEQLKAPWRARLHYLRVLELDANHREAQERLNRLSASIPRSSSKPSLLSRLTGRR
jgi:curved DNA-binding protein CbpA